MSFHIPGAKPKSLIVFLAGLLIGLLVFLPMVFVGISLEKIGMFLTGTAGIAVTWLTAAFMGFLFAAGLYAGRYRQMRSLPWREQVW
jgi:hypothetical protein